MEINIIHLPEHEDRKANVVDLAMLLGNARVIQAVVPLWEQHPSAKSVRGCSLSHLNSLYKQKTNEPILILEDDAVPYKPSWDAGDWITLQNSKLPDDCGVIVIGGDCEKYLDDGSYFLRIEAPMYGSQAVWYNTPLLKDRNFLTHAYQILASSGMGDTDNYNGLCYESILLSALARCNLYAYRPRNMMFTTMESFSTRLNKIIPPSEKAFRI